MNLTLMLLVSNFKVQWHCKILMHVTHLTTKLIETHLQQMNVLKHKHIRILG